MKRLRLKAGALLIDSYILALKVWRTLGTVNSKVGFKIPISSTKVVLTVPEINPIFAATLINPLIRTRSITCARGKNDIWHEVSFKGIPESLIHISSIDIILLWMIITPFGSPVVPEV